MTTFKVANVKLSEKKLNNFTLTESIQSSTYSLIEACGSNLNANLVKTNDSYHSLLKTIFNSFSYHYPLILSPDDVWICITQGLAAHVNQNAEKLRSLFVQHTGKILLNHENTYIKGSSNNDWSSSFDWFSGKIKEFIGKKHNLIVSNFSTTGPIEKAVSEIVLMDVVKNYFDYRETTLCGIPEITLLGTLEDWKDIRTRVEVFNKFGLSWWTEYLLPFLDEFINAKDNKPNLGFWKSLFRYNGGSGGNRINGYINVLFPYVSNYKNVLVKNDTFGIFDTFGGISPSDYPIGISNVPFVWDYYGTIYDMDFLGGFVGSSQDSESLAVRPVLGWAVRDRPVT